MFRDYQYNRGIKVKRFALGITIILSLLLSSCASTAGNSEEDNKTITITLLESPSTGYSWIWGQMGAGHIEMIDESFTSGTLIGEPGVHTFTFAGTEPGHVTLTFSSRQPWQGGGVGDTEAFSVTVYDDMTISYL